MVAIKPTAEEICSASLEALKLLGVSVVEMEVSLDEIDYLVELAQEGEVVPIDVSSPAGGFGSPDLWVATVVPAVAAVLGLRGIMGDFNAAAKEKVEDVVKKVGSPRARRETSRLFDVVLTVVDRPASTSVLEPQQ